MPSDSARREAAGDIPAVFGLNYPEFPVSCRDTWKINSRRPQLPPTTAEIHPQPQKLLAYLLAYCEIKLKIDQLYQLFV
jgi:hypothetical protein